MLQHCVAEIAEPVRENADLDRGRLRRAASPEKHRRERSCDNGCRCGVLPSGPGGGRTWWAHFEFTRINIEPIIRKNKIEELMNVRGVGEKNFLKLKPQITVAPAKAEHADQR